jgi:pimeloyl-ACP methyl ester carboxylesterase
MLIGRCVEWVDAMVSRCLLQPRFVGAHAQTRLSWLEQLRAQVETLTEADWYTAPDKLEPLSVKQRSRRGVSTKSIVWEMPLIAASERLGLLPHSQPARASLQGDRAQAAWIFVHGWLGGNGLSERWGLPFSSIERYDVLSYTLPGHGLRRANLASPIPSFPSRNPARNALTLAVAVAELRQLVEWMKSLGYERIGIVGTSLGAYVAALYATVAPACDRLLLDRPLSRMSEPLRSLAQRRGTTYLELLACLEAIYAAVSPLERSLRMPSDRVEILLGARDRIAGFASGQALLARFGARGQVFAGGHVVPLGRGERLSECLKHL